MPGPASLENGNSLGTLVVLPTTPLLSYEERFHCPLFIYNKGMRREFGVHEAFIVLFLPLFSWALGEWGGRSDPGLISLPLSLICEQLALDFTPKCWPGETRGHFGTASAHNNLKQTGPGVTWGLLRLMMGVAQHSQANLRETSWKEVVCRQWSSDPGLTSSKPVGVFPELTIRGALSTFR